MKPDLKLVKIFMIVLIVLFLIIFIFSKIDFLFVNEEVFSKNLMNGVGIYFFKYENDVIELNVYVRIFGKHIQYNNTENCFLINFWDDYYQNIE